MALFLNYGIGKADSRKVGAEMELRIGLENDRPHFIRKLRKANKEKNDEAFLEEIRPVGENQFLVDTDILIAYLKPGLKLRNGRPY